MDTEFLSAVLPTQGNYCVFVMKDKVRKNIFVESIDALHNTAVAQSLAGAQSYYALSTFDSAGTREAEHALYVRSIFFDLDCGWDDEKQKWKSFRSKREAVTQLYSFLEDTGIIKLGQPWLVDSGGGVHGYLPLDNETTVAEWKPIANMFKRAAKKFNFPIDMTVTADAARVLRSPFTYNYKYDPPREVEVRQRGDIFRLEAIRAALLPHAGAVPALPTTAALMIPGKRPGGEMSTIAKAMAGNSVTYFKNIMKRTAEGTGCQQLAYYIEHAADEGMEPLWRGVVLSMAKYCEDGERASIKLSALHPYDEDRRITKMAAIKGPNSCEAIEGVSPISCDGCPNKGKITNPLALGREVAIVLHRETKQVEPDGEERTVQLPTPPRGFSYGKNGGVYYEKPAEDGQEKKLIMLTNYDLYMSRMFRDFESWVAEFVVVKGKERMTFGVPTEVIGESKALTKVLAKNNVFAVGGMGGDPMLAAYVRACMTDASSSGKHVAVPPNMGWQANGDFVIGDRVISAMGRQYDYTFKSSRLSNVIEATGTSGTLEQWKRIPRMLRDKAIDEPIIWGHCAISLTNAASSLMIFAPRGAQAGSMHLAGKESGAGKTVSSHISNSFFGEPTGLMVGNKTSETTMMQRAGMLGSICLNLDEVTDKNRKSNGEWTPNFLYDYSHGAHKVKGSATGNAEIQQTCVWAAIALLSSNDPQAEAMMGARNHTSLGEMRRFLEWKLPRNWTINFSAAEHEVLGLMSTNYGVAGRRWIEWLQDNKELAQQRWNEVCAYWKKKSGASDNERFWTNLITSYLTACILTNPLHCDLTDYDFNKLVEFFLGIVNYMRRVINTNKMTALDILDAYTREHIGNMVHLKPTGISFLNNPGTMPKNNVRGRVEYEILPGHVEYFIEVKMLKIHCAAIGHSYLEFAKELSSVATVAETRKDLLQGTNNPSLRVKCIRITRSLADMSKEDQIDALGLT